jgi:hypothetical protein
MKTLHVSIEDETGKAVGESMNNLEFKDLSARITGLTLFENGQIINEDRYETDEIPSTKVATVTVDLFSGDDMFQKIMDRIDEDLKSTDNQKEEIDEVESFKKLFKRKLKTSGFIKEERKQILKLLEECGE